MPTPTSSGNATSDSIWLVWTAARGAIGALVAVVIAAVSLVILGLDKSSGSDLAGVAGAIPGVMVIEASVIGIVLTVAEYIQPAVRVPDGRAYRWLGGNRLTAAGVQGAVTGGTVGLVALWGVLGAGSLPFPDLAPVLLPVSTAIGFVVAEIGLDRIRRSGGDSPRTS